MAIVQDMVHWCHRKGGAVAAVENGAQHPVVILYEHALLGEGIARYLRAQSGVEATVASAHDLEAVKSALAYGPAVVIFELSDALRQVDLSTLAPDAVLIDVSTVVARGSANPPDVAGLEKILQAVRCSNSTVSLSAESPPGETLSAPAR